MNTCLQRGASHENSKIVRFTYSDQPSLAQQICELAAKDNSLHVSKAAMITMCIFGIIGLVMFLFETILGLILMIEQ
jgi:hypothetical protein